MSKLNSDFGSNLEFLPFFKALCGVNPEKNVATIHASNSEHLPILLRLHMGTIWYRTRGWSTRPIRNIFSLFDARTIWNNTRGLSTHTIGTPPCCRPFDCYTLLLHSHKYQIHSWLIKRVNFISINIHSGPKAGICLFLAPVIRKTTFGQLLKLKDSMHQEAGYMENKHSPVYKALILWPWHVTCGWRWKFPQNSGP